MKGIGNNNQIVFIEIHKESQSTNIVYLENSYSLLFKRLLREEGFYLVNCLLGEIQYTKMNKVPDNITINGKKAFEKDHIIIEFANNRKQKMYFDSERQMNLYVAREFQGREWRKFR